jgi:signal transduction histidine kinase
VRHAPGQSVDIVVAGAPGDGLRVSVTNPVAGASRGGVSGLGLVGLGERLSLISGTFTAGSNKGRFVVEAWVPWKT